MREHRGPHTTRIGRSTTSSGQQYEPLVKTVLAVIVCFAKRMLQQGAFELRTWNTRTCTMLAPQN